MNDSFDPMVTASALELAQSQSALASVFTETDSLSTVFPFVDSFSAAIASASESYAQMVSSVVSLPSTCYDSFSAIAASYAPAADSFAAVVARTMAEPSMIAPPMPAFGWVEDLLPPLGFALAEKFTSALTALPPIDITLPAFSQIDIMPTAFTLMDSPPPVTFSPYKGSVYPFESEMNIASPLRDPAKDAYEGLLERIRNLQAKLDDDHEVGIWFTSAELNVVIHIEAISYTSPSLISFHGRTNDKEMREIELVRHFSQLDVALMAVPKQQPKANRMGFTADRE